MRTLPARVLLGVLLVQAAWILAVPPFRAIDEPDHAFRAAAVARGEWRSDTATPDGRGGLVVVPRDLVTAAHRQCVHLRYNGPDNCRGLPTADPRLVRVGTGASRYNPAFYWVVGTAARPFHGAGALYAMRIASGLLCALGLAVAAWCLGRRGPPRFAVAGLLIGLSPVFLYSTTVPGPNGIEMVGGVVLWTALLALGPERRDGDGLVVLAGLAGAVVLLTVRTLGPVFALLILVCVLLARWGSVRAIVGAHRRALVPAVVVSGAAAVASVLWVVTQAPLGTHDGDPAAVPYSQLIGLVPTSLLQSVAAAPLRDQPAPLWVYPAYLALVLALVVVGLRRTSGGPRRALVTGLVLVVVVPVVVSTVGLHQVGLVWQGRYLLPFTAGLGVLAGRNADRAGTRLPAQVWAALGFVYAAAQVVACAAVHAAEQDRPTSAGDPGWWQTSTGLVAVLCAFGVGVLLLAVRGAGVPLSDPSGPARAEPGGARSVGHGAGSSAAT